MSEIEKLEARISNLEFALQSLFEIINISLPPETGEEIYKLLRGHYLMSSEIGGFQNNSFIGINI